MEHRKEYMAVVYEQPEYGGAKGEKGSGGAPGEMRVPERGCENSHKYFNTKKEGMRLKELERIRVECLQTSPSVFYQRNKRRLRVVGLALFVVAMSFLAIKKFEATREEDRQMKSITDYINREMDRILELGTREEQNRAFRKLKPELPIKPERMTLTTAVFRYTNTVPHVILKRVIYNPANRLNEDYMSMNLRAPNVVQTLKTFRTKREMPDGTTQTLIWIFSELLDVKISLSTVKRDEAMIRAILKDTLAGLVYMHALSIAHLDMKIGNIMGKTVEGRVIYKLIDFGYAQVMPSSGSVVIPAKNYGTFPYKPPEIVHNHVHGLASDIWSLGAIAWFLSLGYTPFYNDDYRKDVAAFKGFISPRAKDTANNHRFTFLPSTSNALKKFVKDCMQLDPERRPTAEALLSHPFIQGASVNYYSASDDIVYDSSSDTADNSV